MSARSQLLPWKLAGRALDHLDSGDELVRETGWLFNNGVGDDLTMDAFVASGDDEVPPYLETFGLRGPSTQQQTIVEVGSGIGRMTCALTREFGNVVACDLDAGFLERCYEIVGTYGRVDRLRTSHVADGRTLNLPGDSADITLSYLTLQHCQEQDALDLSQEAVRITRPGGKIALHYRGPSTIDPLVIPVGAGVRTLCRVPGVREVLASNRPLMRLAWQASRIHPDQITAQLGSTISDATVWTNSASKLVAADAAIRHYDGINQNHWWLVATVDAPAADQPDRQGVPENQPH